MSRQAKRIQSIFGSKIKADARDFSEQIAFNDHQLAFLLRYVEDRDVLDLGCVQHDPENYRSKYWVHKALKAKAKNLLGLDLSEDGVNYLRTKGFNVEFGDAQDFSLGQSFDVIVAGELIEHLEDFSGFFSCCKAHLRENGKLLISTPNPWYWKNIIMAVLHNEIRVNPEHTCWFCPSTLRSLARRHGFDIKEIEFGSRYLADRLIPLPRGIKHTSWHAVLVISDRLDIIS